MKSLESRVRIFKFQTRLLCCILFMILLTVPIAWAAGQKTMSVQVKQVQVRESPSFTGRILGNLGYGDQVAVYEEKGGWIKVHMQGKGINGWIHQTALSSKKIKLSAGAENVAKYASSDEVALAGKGFNKQVEGEFKAKNPNMDFTWVDKMESIKISSSEILSFIQAGGLNTQGGEK
ncbi:SH3 domain-containing protein [Desulfonema limicola]|uniref:SH3 domain-containing protein n=1 Tax=Desulfonema limicola TaxID=45656 RepID=A0A975GFH0_9BACT|nr:SH3 domain-containing protein [Desulfonema limicola]QTA79170.1 SH3 domain-containing protein [Desulfonema limicola]